MFITRDTVQHAGLKCDGHSIRLSLCMIVRDNAFDEGRIDAELPSVEDYARLRAQYIRDGRGKPPAD